MIPRLISSLTSSLCNYYISSTTMKQKWDKTLYIMCIFNITSALNTVQCTTIRSHDIANEAVVHNDQADSFSLSNVKLLTDSSFCPFTHIMILLSWQVKGERKNCTDSQNENVQDENVREATAGIIIINSFFSFILCIFADAKVNTIKIYRSYLYIHNCFYNMYLNVH